MALVQLVAEEIDAMAGELSGRLEVIEAELSDVRKRLGKLYEAIETSELTLEVLSPRIMSLRHREEQLEAARDEAETRLEQRRVVLPDTEEIVEYVADFRNFLKDGTIPERKALIRNFVEGIEVVGDEATLTYTVPMPSDGVMSESASVLDFVKSGPLAWIRTNISSQSDSCLSCSIGGLTRLTLSDPQRLTYPYLVISSIALTTCRALMCAPACDSSIH